MGIEQLEMDVTRVLKEKKLKKKISSRTSSLDSSCPPGSPFQNNPQLMSHDYAKSPLMEDVHNNEDSLSEPKDEIIEIDLEPTDEAITKFDPRTKQLFEPHKFAPKDLLILLKTIEADENEMKILLRDENEKRKKHSSLNSNGQSNGSSSANGKNKSKKLVKLKNIKHKQKAG